MRYYNAVSKAAYDKFLREDYWYNHLRKRHGTGAEDYRLFALSSITKRAKKQGSEAAVEKVATQLNFFDAKDQNCV